jgi:spore coat polysaccharide biosynthesis protein SpsF
MAEPRPRIFASIEARMGSSRFPGKVLADVAGRPALSRLLARLRRCQALDGIVLATTVDAADDVLEAWARTERLACHRGSAGDVLARVVAAHGRMGSDVVVEVTGDCPLLDPDLVDMAIATFLANACDVVTNCRKPSYPMGVDVQVFPLALLAEVDRTVADPAVREHVSLHFYEHPETYRIIHLMAPPRWHQPDCRLQLDYPEDLELIREVYRRLEPIHGPVFGVGEILAAIRADPSLAAINRHCMEKAPR